VPDDTLTVVDNRTGREYSLPIVDGAIRATDLRQISVEDGDGGVGDFGADAVTGVEGDAVSVHNSGSTTETIKPTTVTTVTPTTLCHRKETAG